jgi:hypothetical protein
MTVSDAVTWVNSGVTYSFDLVHRGNGLMRVSRELFVGFDGYPDADLRYSCFDFHARSPKTDTVTQLIHSWHLGGCTPAIVADAIEETLTEQEQLDKAQWLLLLLRGDSEWCGHNARGDG